MSYRLILASQSPRRKEILSWSGLPFEVIPYNGEEVTQAYDPSEYVMNLAQLKANGVLAQCLLQQSPRHPLVVGMDTVVCLEGEILEKPHTPDKAKEMLLKLSGRTHEVLTGVCLIASPNKKVVMKKFFVQTLVTFDQISPTLLQRYVDSKDPLDKAGGYGVQGAAQAFIKSLTGSYSNVVGFPLCEFLKELSAFLGQFSATEQDL